MGSFPETYNDPNGSITLTYPESDMTAVRVLR